MEQLDGLKSLASEASAKAQEVLNEFKDKNSLNLVLQNTFVHYLERIEANCHSISILIDELPRTENSIGILLRNNITDYFNLSYISMGKGESDENWRNRICIVNYNQLENFISYIKQEKELNWIDNSEYEQANNYLNIEVQVLQNLVNINLSHKQNCLPRTFSIAKMMNSNDLFKDTAKMAYDTFKYYSQYEHFGYLSGLMQKSNKENNLRMLSQALRLIYESQELCCLNLGIKRNK